MSRLSPWGPLSPVALGLAVFVFAVDQAHKWWMLSAFAIAERQPVALTSFFDLVLAWNQGVSYGLFRTHQQGALVGVSLLISLVLWFWACRSASALVAVGLGLIIGGAMSNAADRVNHGAVADFFHFHLGGFSWYVFNVADVAIVAGVAILLYDSLFERGRVRNHGNA